MNAGRITPPQLLVLSFAGSIFIGSLLLTTPWAVKTGQVDYLTSLFTATTSVCVTGLVVVDTSTHWTLFGQVVILLLIQIGGLGVMSFATFFALIFGWKIQLRQRLIMQQSMNQSSVGGIVRIFRYLLIVSFSIEAVGAIILAIHWIPLLGFKKALWFGVFHSVSAFNNAGIDLFGNFQSLTAFTGNITVNLVISILIILGSLGFIVLYEITNYRKNRTLSLHARVVLITSALLIAAGTGILLISEYHHALKDLPWGTKLMASYFQAVSPRSGGYTTINLNSLYLSSQLLIILLMFIGGSPGSAGGGIKTSTFALLWIAIISQLRGKKDNEIFKRHIPNDDMFQALTIALLYVFTLLTITFFMSMLRQSDFVKILFEVVSALGTCGLSLGLTLDLIPLEQIIIIITMFLGRVGPLTLGFALAYRSKKPDIHYPKGKIMIG
ncbi:MAG: TrkH family potassium uptake protein [Syntrophomonadaceae bacterium]|nr:TrkH family potassium uptake protein [Syntrophomonadaceae bacterium]